MKLKLNHEGKKLRAKFGYSSEEADKIVSEMLDSLENFDNNLLKLLEDVVNSNRNTKEKTFLVLLIGIYVGDK